MDTIFEQLNKTQEDVQSIADLRNPIIQKMDELGIKNQWPVEEELP